MQKAIDKGEFIENAVFSGNMYGTSKAAVQAVQAKNLICILDIDMQGVRNIKKTDLNPIYVSIQPPSMAVLVSTEGRLFYLRSSWWPAREEFLGVTLSLLWTQITAHTGFECSLNHIWMPSVFFQEKRLRDRKTETEESLQKRLHAAQVDMEFGMYLLFIYKNITTPMFKKTRLNIILSLFR